MMGWDNKAQQEESEVNRHNHHHHHHNNTGHNVGLPYVKVMTDDQLETLRKQISVYATICEQLVEMHKNLTSHPDLPGVRLGNLYCDPMMTSAGHKITARQRWTPTPVQLQILERIFEQGNGTPSKQKIKDITTELGQHGQISETNVYNWFQNRRARSKRKQHNPGGSAESEAEAEPEPDSPKDKKFHHHNNQDAANNCFQGSEMNNNSSSDDHANKPDPVYQSNGGVRGLAQMPFYDGLLSNPRSEHLGGKMEVGGAYSLYDLADDFING